MKFHLRTIKKPRIQQTVAGESVAFEKVAAENVEEIVEAIVEAAESEVDEAAEVVQ